MKSQWEEIISLMCEHLRHKSFQLEVIEDKERDTLSGSCLGSGLVTEIPHTKVYTIDSNCCKIRVV